MSATFEQALGHHQAGRFREAEALYREILKTDPGNADALNNLGQVYEFLERTDDAIDAYRKAVAAVPGFAPALANLGAALLNKGEAEEAVDCLERALKDFAGDPDVLGGLGKALAAVGRPDEAVAHLRRARDMAPEDPVILCNLGTALQANGDLPEAEAAFEAAVALDPGFAEAHYNLGLALQAQGRVEEAMAVFQRSLEIDPNNPRIYKELWVLLKVVEAADASEAGTAKALIEKLQVQAPSSPEPSQMAHYLDEFFPGTAERSYRDAVRKLPPMEEDKITLASPPYHGAPGPKIATPPERAVALIITGLRSGSGFLHSLMDGHSQIATLPGHYMTGFFGRGIWEKISDPDCHEMVRRFVSLYGVMFDANNPKGVPADALTARVSQGVDEGYTTMGENRDQSLKLDEDLFVSHFTALLEGRRTIDCSDFFKLLHMAFEQTLGRYANQELIFYHIHNPENFAFMNYLRYFPRSKLLTMVREPLQGCESWLSPRPSEHPNYQDTVMKLIQCLFKFDQVIFGMHDSRGIRLEDIKNDPKKAMGALCGWLEIEEGESLYTSTMQGLAWWGDPGSIRFGRKDPVAGFDKGPIKRKVGHLFSERDQKILGTLFYPLRKLYGYVEEDDGRFKADLRSIRPMLDEPFDFEKKVMDECLPRSLDPKKNVEYRLLRAALKDRWAVLDAGGTYTNMIPPLPP